MMLRSCLNTLTLLISLTSLSVWAANPGDAVKLSPDCSSYGSGTIIEARGEYYLFTSGHVLTKDTTFGQRLCSEVTLETDSGQYRLAIDSKSVSRRFKSVYVDWALVRLPQELSRELQHYAIPVSRDDHFPLGRAVQLDGFPGGTHDSLSGVIADRDSRYRNNEAITIELSHDTGKLLNGMSGGSVTSGGRLVGCITAQDIYWLDETRRYGTTKVHVIPFPGEKFLPKKSAVLL